MNKFSEHIKKSVQENKQEVHNDYVDLDNVNIDEYESLIDKYSTYSKEELMKEFLMESRRLKERGGLEDEQISNIEKVLKPHLNTEQQNMFDSLISEIK